MVSANLFRGKMFDEKEWCIQNKKKIKEYRRKFYLRHREELKRKSQEYRDKHIEKVRKKNMEYYYQHREKRIADREKYSILHKEEQKEYNRKYRDGHKEKAKSYMQEYWEGHAKEKKEYFRKHHTKCLEYSRKSKAKYRKEYNDKIREMRHQKGIAKKYNLMLGISGTPAYQKVKSMEHRYKFKNAGELIIQTIQEIYDENIINNGGVLRCIYCGKELTNKKATLEHKQPLSRSGTNDKENLAIACRSCNSGKRDKTEAEYREWLDARKFANAIKDLKTKLYSGQ